jgi:hypothetical protein
MSYSRGEIYAFKDATTGELEINFSKRLSYEHNRTCRCGGHLLDVKEVKLLKTICEKYLESLNKGK